MRVINAPPASNRLLVGFAVLLFAAAATARAWVSDDAYITFRTVVNFVEGYGLTWNPGERVQVYTHPLWMFLMSGAYAVTREIHFTSMFFSLILSVAAVWGYTRRLAVSSLSAFFGVLALTLSKAYVDFSTSGLENPLANLLLVLFVWQLLTLSVEPSPRRLAALSFVASLGMLTRLDLVLIFAPALLLVFWRQRSRGTLFAFALGQLPLALWEMFSLFYYGLPLPNTFYAKLNTGIPQVELTRQGFLYLLNSLEFDPLTPLLIAVGAGAAFALKDRRALALALGMGLYLVYVVRIGGDFMSGRFLAAPLLIAVILITRFDFERLSPQGVLLPFVIVLAVGFSAPQATLDFKDPTLRLPPEEHVDSRGISDERLNYAPFTGLFAASRHTQLPSHVWAWQGVRDAGRERTFAVKFAIGFYGFNAGRQIHVVDQLALADPLLARLPAARILDWRIGHFIRHLPDGYTQTYDFGVNRIKDPDLAQLYEKISLITRGPLVSRARLVEIFKLNTGQYDHLVDWEAYRYPEMLEKQHGEGLRTPKPPETPSDDSSNTLFGPSGLIISLQETTHAPTLELTLDSDDAYRIIYLHAGEVVASQNLSAPQFPEGGLALHILAAPPEAVATGYDQIQVFPIFGSPPFSLGHLQLGQ